MKKCLIPKKKVSPWAWDPFLEFLNIEEVFNMDGRLIISVYDSYLYSWNDLNNKKVKGGHYKVFEGSKIGFVLREEYDLFQSWSESNAKIFEG